MRSPLGRLLRPLLALVLLAHAAPAAAEERFHYRWNLGGFVGTLASIFLPGEGEGLLTVEQLPQGVERAELLVTSNQSKANEYFRYGSEWKPSERRTLRAWSDLSWRGEKKSKRAELADEDVLDVVAAIQLLRAAPPEHPKRLEIWSDGKLYSVVVLPRERERRRLGGREVAVQRYYIQGLSVPGRRLWKGELDLWIADDPAATPIEIVVVRKGARVRLQLVETPPPGAAEVPKEPS